MVIYNPTDNAIGKDGISIDASESVVVDEGNGIVLLAEFPALRRLEEKIVKEVKDEPVKKAGRPKKQK